MGSQIANKVTDYILNVDVTNASFDLEVFFEESKKLGLDFGDLEEYGFDVKSASCGGKACFDKGKFKNYDEFLN